MTYFSGGLIETVFISMSFSIIKQEMGPESAVVSPKELQSGF